MNSRRTALGLLAMSLLMGLVVVSTLGIGTSPAGALSNGVWVRSEASLVGGEPSSDRWRTDINTKGGGVSLEFAPNPAIGSKGGKFSASILWGEPPAQMKAGVTYQVSATLGQARTKTDVPRSISFQIIAEVSNNDLGLASEISWSCGTAIPTICKTTGSSSPVNFTLPKFAKNGDTRVFAWRVQQCGPPCRVEYTYTWQEFAAPKPTPTTTPSTTPTPSPAARSGYWMIGANGSIYGFGDSASFPRIILLGGVSVVGFDRASDGDGLWVLDSRGKVHVRGTATFFGNVALSRLSNGDRVASISVTPSGRGYWVFTDFGRVFDFGDALNVGDLPRLGIKPVGAIVASAPTPSGRGYYMLGSDGGVFAFGDAKFVGSIPQVLPPGSLVCPIIGLVPAPSGNGYWMVSCDGGVFAFGGAQFRGSIPGVLPKGTALNSPINGLVPYGNGYLMVGSDGGVFTFSDRKFLGSLGSNPPAGGIVAIVAFGV